MSAKLTDCAELYVPWPGASVGLATAVAPLAPNAISAAAQGWPALNVHVGLIANVDPYTRYAPPPTSSFAYVCNSGALNPLSIVAHVGYPFETACVTSTSFVCAGVRLPGWNVLLATLGLHTSLSKPPAAPLNAHTWMNVSSPATAANV